MNIKEYFDMRYGGTVGLSRTVAVALGIPYPPKSGWLLEHGHREITAAQASLLANVPVPKKAGRAQAKEPAAPQTAPELACPCCGAVLILSEKK